MDDAFKQTQHIPKNAMDAPNLVAVAPSPQKGPDQNIRIVTQQTKNAIPVQQLQQQGQTNTQEAKTNLESLQIGTAAQKSMQVPAPQNQQIHRHLQKNDAGSTIGNGTNGVVMRTIPQNHHIPQVKVQVTAPSIQLQPTTPTVIQQEILPVVSGNQGRVAEKKGRFSIMKDIPKEKSPQRTSASAGMNDPQFMQTKQNIVNASRQIDESQVQTQTTISSIPLQGQHHPQQTGISMPNQIQPQQHLSPNPLTVQIPVATDKMAMTLSHSSQGSHSSQTSTRTIQTGVVMPIPNAVPDGKTQIKGRFVVTKTGEKGKNHIRSQSAPQHQYQPMMVSGLSVPVPLTVQINPQSQNTSAASIHGSVPSSGQLQSINAKIQQGQQMIHGNPHLHAHMHPPSHTHSQNIHNQRGGVQSANTSPRVLSHEFVNVQSVNTFPPPPAMGSVGSVPPAKITASITSSIASVPTPTPPTMNMNKPPMLPKGSSAPPNLSNVGPSSMGKMFHFLDKLKYEAVETDKLVNFLRNKNKELETRCKEVDKLYREERSAREELTRQMKEMREQLQLLKQSQTKVPRGGALPNNVSSDTEDVDETNENLMGMMFIDKT